MFNLSVQQQQLREQQLLQLIQQQEVRNNNNNNNKSGTPLNLRWVGAKQPPTRVKSLAEIQAEEQEHLMKVIIFKFCLYQINFCCKTCEIIGQSGTYIIILNIFYKLYENNFEKFKKYYFTCKDNTIIHSRITLL